MPTFNTTGKRPFEKIVGKGETAQYQLLTPLEKKPFEKIMGKGGNACNQHSLLFQQCFLLFQRQNSVLFCCLQIYAFKVENYKILSFGEKTMQLNNTVKPVLETVCIKRPPTLIAGWFGPTVELPELE